MSYSDFATFVTMGFYAEMARDLDNHMRIEAVVRERQEALARKPSEPVVLRLDCFNKAEADDLTAYMNTRYPDVPFFTTTVAFDRLPWAKVPG